MTAVETTRERWVEAELNRMAGMPSYRRCVSLATSAARWTTSASTSYWSRSRALSQIATLPSTSALRREQIKLQVALITPLMYVKGYSAPETKAAVEQARLLIEQAEAFGEPPEDPLLLFRVLHGVYLAAYIAFDGDVCRDLSTQVLSLAEKQTATTGPLILAHRLVGTSLLHVGDIATARAHFDRSIAYFSANERLSSRFALERVFALVYRACALWLLGYPAAALSDVDHAANDVRRIGQAGPLMIVLTIAGVTLTLCGHEASARALSDEVVALAHEKSAAFWRQYGLLNKGCLLAIAGKPDDAIRTITAGFAALQETETVWRPWYWSNLIRAYGVAGQLDEAWRCVSEANAAIEGTKERWCEAEVSRVAGEITLMTPQADAAKAQAYFERALGDARQQQAKSWELRAAMSMARLWRDRSKRKEARELLAPVYGWFTEGFDTRDLKEAKALLDELSS